MVISTTARNWNSVTSLPPTHLAKSLFSYASPSHTRLGLFISLHWRVSDSNLLVLGQTPKGRI